MNSQGSGIRGGRAVTRLNALLLATFLTIASAAVGIPAAARAAEPAAVQQNSYADVVSRVTPAVVTVRASRRTREAQQFPFSDDPTLRELFGNRLPRQSQPEE